MACEVWVVFKYSGDGYHIWGADMVGVYFSEDVARDVADHIDGSYEKTCLFSAGGDAAMAGELQRAKRVVQGD